MINSTPAWRRNMRRPSGWDGSERRVEITKRFDWDEDEIYFSNPGNGYCRVDLRQKWQKRLSSSYIIPHIIAGLLSIICVILCYLDIIETLDTIKYGIKWANIWSVIFSTFALAATLFIVFLYMDTLRLYFGHFWESWSYRKYKK